MSVQAVLRKYYDYRSILNVYFFRETVPPRAVSHRFYDGALIRIGPYVRSDGSPSGAVDVEKRALEKRAVE